MQNIKLIIAISIFLSSNITFAQNNRFSNTNLTSKNFLGDLSQKEIIKICTSGGLYGTKAVIGCAKQEWEKADTLLNKTYQIVLKSKEKDDNISQIKSAPSLIKSQQLWLDYRKNFCDSLYFSLHGDDTSNGGGTGVPAEYMDCMTELSKKRVQELNEYFPN